MQPSNFGKTFCHHQTPGLGQGCLAGEALKAIDNLGHSATA